jgi:hypothetical protein
MVISSSYCAGRDRDGDMYWFSYWNTPESNKWTLGLPPLRHRQRFRWRRAFLRKRRYVKYRIAVGRQQGRKAFTLREEAGRVLNGSEIECG